MMYLCAWTINHGENVMTDHYELIDNIGAVDKWKKEIHPVAHCWAVSKVLDASEPHWIEGEFA